MKLFILKCEKKKPEEETHRSGKGVGGERPSIHSLTLEMLATAIRVGPVEAGVCTLF